jgi:lipoprotein-anchoring transpeptidase ErfK/SrfK
MSKTDLSRREFLKLSGYGFLGALPQIQFFPPHDEFENLQGRVTDRVLWSYDAPSLKANRKKLYWRDLILSITNSALNDDEMAFNRIWYEIAEGGFVYSGGVQPVRTLLNDPQSISLKGALGEVSVPYTDAHLEPDANAQVMYRLYYETIHWVKASAIHPADGHLWYALLDDKSAGYYYVPAEHIRLIPEQELAAVSPQVPENEKRIEVRLRDQLVLAYERNNLVFGTRASTGMRRQSGSYTTPEGEFITFHKRPTRHMAAGDLAASGFDLPGVPWVLYITKSGISFHGTYWHNDFGRPRSHGCINLTPQSAKWLYRWTTPSVQPDKELAYGYVGTKVEIKI